MPDGEYHDGVFYPYPTGPPRRDGAAQDQYQRDLNEFEMAALPGYKPNVGYVDNTYPVQHRIFQTPGAAVSSQQRAANQELFLKWEANLIFGKKFYLHGVGLFGGNDQIGMAIRNATSSQITHVGLILKDQFDLLYIFESNASPDRVLAGVFPQVQIAFFEETVINGYNGTVGMRKFVVPQSYYGTPKPFMSYNLDYSNYPERFDISDFVKQYLGTPYKEEKFDLVRAVYEFNKTFDPSSLFCSELCAFCLQEEGLMKKDILPNNYVPCSFDMFNPKNMMDPSCLLGTYTLLHTNLPGITDIVFGGGFVLMNHLLFSGPGRND